MSRRCADELQERVLETDTAIIGAGAAGLSLALSLGRDFTVIESGADGVDWELQKLHRSVVRGQPTNPDSVRVRAIGGATLRWTGRCIELDDCDFEDRPWIAPSPWPIDKSELAPWYAKAWELIGLDGFAARGKGSATEPLKGDASASLRPCRWEFAAEKKGASLNFAHRFSSVFDKESARLIYAAEAVELITDGRKVKAIRIVDRGGVARFVRARRFVLAAGCIDNITLLLHKFRTTPAFLGQIEPWLGRGFMQHLRVDAGALAQDKRQFQALQRRFGMRHIGQGRRHETGIALHPDFARSSQIGNASAFFEYQSDLSGTHPLRILAAAGRRLGYKTALPHGIARLWIDAEQVVSKDSRVSLHHSLGPIGLYPAAVDWRIATTDVRTVHTLSLSVRKWLDQEGFGTLSEPLGMDEDHIDPMSIVDSNHPLGGTRMSDYPAMGVVDRDCRVHGCDNLWVVGGSVFSSGGHANPTLTIMALALRLADNLIGQTNTTRSSGCKNTGDKAASQSQ